MILTISAILITILITVWFNERIGRVKVIRFPSTDGPPDLTREVAVMPPTRWAIFIGYIREVLRLALVFGGGLVAAGWLLGGCIQ